MTDWFDLAAWQSFANFAKTATDILDALTKMRTRLSRKKTTRKLDEEVDALRADLQRLIDVMTKHVSSHRTFIEAFVRTLRTVEGSGVPQVKAYVNLLKSVADATKGLQDAVLAHERRLKALEHRRRR